MKIILPTNQDIRTVWGDESAFLVGIESEKRVLRNMELKVETLSDYSSRKFMESKRRRGAMKKVSKIPNLRLKSIEAF